MGAGGLGDFLEGETRAVAIRKCRLSTLTLSRATTRLDKEKSLKELHGSVKSAQILERRALLTTKRGTSAVHFGCSNENWTSP